MPATRKLFRPSWLFTQIVVIYTSHYFPLLHIVTLYTFHILVIPIQITLFHSSFKTLAIGDQSLTKSARVPLNTYDNLYIGNMDMIFSYHNFILGGSSSCLLFKDPHQSTLQWRLFFLGPDKKNITMQITRCSQYSMISVSEQKLNLENKERN